MQIKSISIKLFLILGTTISVFVVFFIFHNYEQYRTELRENIQRSLDLALDFDITIRKYVSTRIRPAMTKLTGPDEFVPETMSTSFVARSIFADVQKKHPDFILKFSSKNPKNPKNLAGPEEAKIIDFFNAHPDQSRWKGLLYLNKQQYIAVLNARRTDDSCLHCHGEPEDAPSSLIKRYGNKAGFHYKNGQVIATDTVAANLGRMKAKLARHLRLNLSVTLMTFLGLFATIFLGIKFLIVNRISHISRYFKKIAEADDYNKIEHIATKGKDEIDTMAQNFNILADKITSYHLSLNKEKAERIITNSQLQARISGHHKTKEELQELYDNLETQINKRTGDLSEANSLLQNKSRDLEKSNHELQRTRDALEKQNGAMLVEREKLANLFSMVEKAKREWEMSMDCINDLIMLTDQDRIIKRCNGAVLNFTGKGYNEVIGKIWTSLLDDDTLAQKAISGEPVEYYHKPSKRWFYLHLYNHDNDSGQVVTLHDFTDNQKAVQALKAKSKEVEDAYSELKQAQSQLLQNEKMASIGQLAAGVAHEINNPVGFISSNLGSLSKYIVRLNDFVEFQAKLIQENAQTAAIDKQREQRQKLKLDFIQKDIIDLIDESLDGCGRVKKIVQDLKGFSRVDETEKQQADINECLETTLNIVWNELKYKAQVEKDYGELETIVCYPQQLNQVFMNLLVNAAHAIEKKGVIKIKTWQDSDFVYTSISDTGMGITAENQKRIFEPFFTTKEVGKGTGLGLSIVYDIVTKNHNGDIEVASEESKGTTFTVKLPIK